VNLFYHPNIDIAAREVTFEKDESRHITKVLRRTIGDTLHITNGKGHLISAKLTQIGLKFSEAVIESVEKIEPRAYQLHMAVAPTKNNDRFEWFLEKATEIGIDIITPLFCDHSERKVIKPERLEKIIESAMKQSLNAYKPVLKSALSFSEFIQQNHENWTNCIAHCQDSSKERFQKLVNPGESILLLIGPEGDFSSKEIELARKNGFNPVSLGNSRLRTETAAIAGCHTVALVNS